MNKYKFTLVCNDVGIFDFDDEDDMISTIIHTYRLYDVAFDFRDTVLHLDFERESTAFWPAIESAIKDINNVCIKGIPRLRVTNVEFNVLENKIEG